MLQRFPEIQQPRTLPIVCEEPDLYLQTSNMRLLRSVFGTIAISAALSYASPHSLNTTNTLNTTNAMRGDGYGSIDHGKVACITKTGRKYKPHHIWLVSL